MDKEQATSAYLAGQINWEECREVLEGNRNTCDKCGIEAPSEYLTWLSAEDFTPKPGEYLQKTAYQYDALCESCYRSELININYAASNNGE